MPARNASAHWEGSLVEGQGHIKTASGAVDLPYDWGSRAGEGTKTNPEELIAAAHAGCFNMALSHGLTGAGFPPAALDTTATVHLEKTEAGFEIPRIELHLRASVPGIGAEQFAEIANGAKAGCPVSKVLAGAKITLHAELV